MLAWHASRSDNRTDTSNTYVTRCLRDLTDWLTAAWLSAAVAIRHRPSPVLREPSKHSFEQKKGDMLMRRWIVVGLLTLGIMLASAGTALATHCYVADKPDGVGTNGAFQREEGDPVDTFQWDLPDPAHERGSQTHGILELEE
jgi:hypothetical protein